MDIVVNDASILIDLIDIDLINEFFKLRFVFYTTNLILEEVNNNEVIISKIEVNDLRIDTPDDREQIKIVEMNYNFSNLSIQDCSCLWLSKKRSAMMLTGDKALTKTGRGMGLEVHGSLWVLEQLVEEKVISRGSAVIKLRELMRVNPRIPERESDDLIIKWS